MKTIHDARYIELLGLLRAAREGLDVKQADLSTRLGKHAGYISKIETAERRLDLVELVEICKALGVPVGSVLPPRLKHALS